MAFDPASPATIFHDKLIIGSLDSWIGGVVPTTVTLPPPPLKLICGFHHYLPLLFPLYRNALTQDGQTSVSPFQRVVLHKPSRDWRIKRRWKVLSPLPPRKHPPWFQYCVRWRWRRRAWKERMKLQHVWRDFVITGASQYRKYSVSTALT